MPVVAIEVDGLLAVSDTYAGTDQAQVIDARITVSRDAYPRVTRAEPIWEADGTWTTRARFSRLGVDWVNDLLATGTDVVWASTWLEHANTIFGPILDLPKLPVALTETDWSGPSVGDAKAQQVVRRFDGRPLLLVTDLPPVRGREVLAALRRPRDRAITHLQLIPWTRGVRGEDITQMNTWLQLARTGEGHEHLKQHRRRTLARARRRTAHFGVHPGGSQPSTARGANELRQLSGRYANVSISAKLRTSSRASGRSLGHPWTSAEARSAPGSQCGTEPHAKAEPNS